MRNERMGLVQTPDQLRFSYEAVIEGIRFFHTERVSVNVLTYLFETYNVSLYTIFIYKVRRLDSDVKVFIKMKCGINIFS